MHVKPEANAASLAQHRGVSIETFDIIYKLLEEFYTDYRRIRIINKDAKINHTNNI